MKIILETPRFLLREFMPEDADLLFALNADPGVIKYTGDQPFNSVSDAEKLIEEYDQYRLYGYGRWAVIDRFSHEFTGWCGLKFNAETGETDIGYRFFRKHWNKGYATETAAACLNAAFKKFNLHYIIARAVKANTASIKVLENIGMKYKSDYDFHGMPGVIYEKYGKL